MRNNPLNYTDPCCPDSGHLIGFLLLVSRDVAYVYISKTSSLTCYYRDIYIYPQPKPITTINQSYFSSISIPCS